MLTSLGVIWAIWEIVRIGLDCLKGEKHLVRKGCSVKHRRKL